MCYFTGIFYAVARQISMLFIDNNISAFGILCVCVWVCVCVCVCVSVRVCVCDCALGMYYSCSVNCDSLKCKITIFMLIVPFLIFR